MREQIPGIMTWMFVPPLLPNSYIEALTSSVALFGDGPSKEVIKVK